MGTVKRMWLNVPSSHDALHSYHGMRVLADADAPKDSTTCRVWPLSGDIVSMQVPKSALSTGWGNR